MLRLPVYDKEPEKVVEMITNIAEEPIEVIDYASKHTIAIKSALTIKLYLPPQSSLVALYHLLIPLVKRHLEYDFVINHNGREWTINFSTTKDEFISGYQKAHRQKT